MPLQGGQFSVLLGQVTSLDAIDWGAQSLWLSVQVGTDPELTPRQRITSVPLAIHAEIADHLQGPPTNLLINGDFANFPISPTSTAPPSWELVRSGSGSLCDRGAPTAGTTLSRQPKPASEPSGNAIQVEPGWDTGQGVCQIVSVQGGKSYTLSVIEKVTSDGIADVELVDDGSTPKSVTVSGSDGSFTGKSVTITTSSDATHLAVRLYRRYQTGAGTATFASAILVKGPKPITSLSQLMPPAAPVVIAGLGMRDFETSTPQLRVQNISPTENVGLQLDNTSVPNGHRYMLITDDGGQFRIRDNTMAQERLMITASGDVGIGVRDPSRALEIRGTGIYVNTNSPNNGLEVNGIVKLDWAGVPPAPPTYSSIIWQDHDDCLKVTFSNGSTKTLACK